MNPQSLPLALLSLFLVMFAVSCETQRSAHRQKSDDQAQSEAAFASLKKLVGTWEREGTDPDTFRIEFRLTAGETVLVESWMRGEEVHSLTLYHQDEDGLIATHYCPQGNQPRLRFRPDGDGESVRFEFAEATNQTAGASMQTELELWVAKDELRRREVYTANHQGVDEESTLELRRKSPIL